MHIKFKAVSIITSFVIAFILYIIVLIVLGLPNPVYKAAPNFVGYDSLLKPFDPVIPDTVSYRQYGYLKDSIKTMRELKNGEYRSGSSAQFAGILGTTDGIECDTCTLRWIHHGPISFDKLLRSQDYLMLLGWKLNIKVYPDGFWTSDSVQFYTEHNQAYLRKFVKLSYSSKNKYRDYQMVDKPVRFRYNSEADCVMIPVNKTVRRVTEIVLLAIGIAVCSYYLVLLGVFFWFLVDVSKGNTFTDLNMRRLKIIAYSLLAIPLVSLILNLLLRLIFIPYLTSDVVLKIDILNGYWKVLALGVIFLVIYLSFRQGKKLKEEQELTI